MTLRTLVVLYLSLLLFQFCRSVDFSTNSFTAVVKIGSIYHFKEFTINLIELQSIQLPTGKICAGCQLNVDSSGTLALVPMYTGNSPFDDFGYAYNVKAAIADTTVLTSQSSTTSAMVMNGQDTWFNVGGDVVYQSRSSSGPGTTIYSSGSAITYLQLVGTKLYALIGTDVMVMSPIVKSGTGTFTTVVSNMRAFTVSGNALYCASSDQQYIYKYFLDSSGTTATYGFRLNILNNIAPIYSMYSISIGASVYVMLASTDGVNSYIYKLNDVFTTFAISSQILLSNSPTITIFSVGPSPKPTCSDTFKNQDESDVDCGGLICSGCAIGKICTSNNDCLSKQCTSGLCAVSCTDGIKNQGETDIDCGGPCSKCADGKTCSTKADCVNDYCTSGNQCATPTCSDTVKNQDETDVDCGGTKCNGCIIGKTCSANSDCKSNKCTSNICAASCTDGIKNQDETDIDCGGTVCGKCADAKSCKSNSDCTNNFCNGALKCATPTCTDGAQNRDESDIDCGGSYCNACANGKKCAANGDCVSKKCTNLVCADSCYDGILNQDETDIDCGGATCGACEDAKTCAKNSDCLINYCNPNNKCSTPSCSDGFLNQDETDVDCGGSTGCNRCALGQSCAKGSDCASNTCDTVCVGAPVSPPVTVPASAPVAKTPSNSPVNTPVNTGTPFVSSPVPPVAAPITEQVPSDQAPSGQVPSDQVPLDQAPQSDSPQSATPSISSHTTPPVVSTPVKYLVSSATATMTSLFALIVDFVLLAL